MQLPLRVAILECDTPLDPVVDKYGRYGDIFKALLRTAADSLSQPDFSSKNLELSAYDVVSKQEYPDLENVDAVLLSGSSTLLCISSICLLSLSVG
jgi:hypothetical protein